MDRMYRPQQHIYDLTRKYYLLGRDRLIAELGARPADVLDIGCGTGRNLALIGQRYPAARLFGLDAAAPMLEIAARKLERACRAGDTGPRGGRGARSRDAVRRSGTASTTSPSPTACRWSTTPRPPCARPCGALAPGGTLHIVDFGDMAGLPGWFRRAMVAWLARFHVRHRPRSQRVLRELSASVSGRVETIEIKRRYALLQRLRPALTRARLPMMDTPTVWC